MHFASYGGDWNAYPAENAVVPQAPSRGPLGDQDWALLWVTASRPSGQPELLPQVEVVLVRPAEEDSEADDSEAAQVIQGSLAGLDPAPLLLGVRSLEIADADGNGKDEALLDVVHQPCCGEGAEPVEERLMLRLSSGEFMVSAAPPSEQQQASRPLDST